MLHREVRRTISQRRRARARGTDEHDDTAPPFGTPGQQAIDGEHLTVPADERARHRAVSSAASLHRAAPRPASEPAGGWYPSGRQQAITVDVLGHAAVLASSWAKR